MSFEGCCNLFFVKGELIIHSPKRSEFIIIVSDKIVYAFFRFIFLNGNIHWLA